MDSTRRTTSAVSSVLPLSTRSSVKLRSCCAARDSSVGFMPAASFRNGTTTHRLGHGSVSLASCCCRMFIDLALVRFLTMCESPQSQQYTEREQRNRDPGPEILQEQRQHSQ